MLGSNAKVSKFKFNLLTCIFMLMLFVFKTLTVNYISRASDFLIYKIYLKDPGD